jgi:hypothetical protein
MNVERFVCDGETYTPILGDGGRFLDLDDLTRLATQKLDPIGPARRTRFIIATEEQPDNDTPPLDLEEGRFEVRSGCPLVFGDSGLVVGEVEEVTYAEGPHLVATIRIHGSVLGDIIWRAIKGGLLDGVCSVFTDYVDDAATGRCVEGTIKEVRLGASESNCLPGCRLIEAWED